MFEEGGVEPTARDVGGRALAPLSGNGSAYAPFPAADVRAFSEVVRAIYEAALTYEAWPATLSRIGALFDAAGAAVVFYNGNVQTDFIHAPELQHAVDTYLREEWWRQDLHAQRAIEQHLAHGDTFSDFTIASPEEIDTHPIYEGFFSKVGFGWLMACVLLPDESPLVTLSVPRAKAKGPFSTEEIESLRLLGRHVEQALRISLRLAALESSEGLLRSALDAVDAGIYALGPDRRLVTANAAGEAQMDNFFGFPEGRMTPNARREEAARFDALLAGEDAATVGRAPQSCILTGTDGARIAIWALPVPSDAIRRRVGVAEGAETLLFSTPVARDRRVDPAVIRDLFQLSLGEARVASLVGSGVTVRDAAERLGVTEGTARLVLKHVFRKLGINRQAELALRLSALGGIPASRPGTD